MKLRVIALMMFALSLASCRWSDEIYVNPAAVFKGVVVPASLVERIVRRTAKSKCANALLQPYKYYFYGPRSTVRVIYREPNKILGDGVPYLPKNLIYVHANPYKGATGLYDIKSDSFTYWSCNREPIPYRPA